MSVLERAQMASNVFDWAQRASVWEYHMGGGVDTADVLEAVLACAVCLRLHTPALSGSPYPVGPRIVRRFVREQADGYTDGYEDTGKGSQ